MPKMRLKLFYRFLHTLVLINKCVIKYARITIKLECIKKQRLEDLNNPLNISLDTPCEEIVVGAYEANYCADYAKAIRKELINQFMKKNGVITFALIKGRITNIHELCLRRVVKECNLQFDRKEDKGTIQYIIREVL